MIIRRQMVVVKNNSGLVGVDCGKTQSKWAGFASFCMEGVFKGGAHLYAEHPPLKFPLLHHCPAFQLLLSKTYATVESVVDVVLSRTPLITTEHGPTRLSFLLLFISNNTRCPSVASSHACHTGRVHGNSSTV